MKKIISAVAAAVVLSATSLAADQNTLSAQNNPFEELQKIQQQMDQVFNQLHQKFLNDTTFSDFNNAFVKAPAADVIDKGDHYLVKADIPGAEAKSIKVTEKDGVLKIEASTVKEEKKKSDNFVRQERFVGQFVKMMTLPKDADASKLKTNYKNGVLEVTIPKRK